MSDSSTSSSSGASTSGGAASGGGSSQPGPDAERRSTSQPGPTAEGGQNFGYGQPPKSKDAEKERAALYGDTDPEEGGQNFGYGQPVERPEDGALKAEWVAYAVARGADEDEADSMTKDDLIAQYG